MDAKMNGEATDVDITMKQTGDGTTRSEDLFVNDMRVIRVTHSLVDDIPVVLVLEGDVVVEVDRQAFYAAIAIDEDWQPGEQSSSMGIT